MKKIEIVMILLLLVFFTGCGKNESTDADVIVEQEVVMPKEDDVEQEVAMTKEDEAVPVAVQWNSDAFEYDKEGDFLMVIEDTFSITGRGTVVTGRIQRGTLKMGDTIEIIGEGDSTITTTVIGIEHNRDSLEEAYAGEDVGIFLDEVERSDVARNQAIVAPGTLKPTTSFIADVTLYSADDITVTAPAFTTDMSVNCAVWIDETSGKVTFEQGTTELAYGESARVTITLDKPMILIPDIPLSISYDESGIGEGNIVELLE